MNGAMREGGGACRHLQCKPGLWFKVQKKMAGAIEASTLKPHSAEPRAKHLNSTALILGPDLTTSEKPQPETGRLVLKTSTFGYQAGSIYISQNWDVFLVIKLPVYTAFRRRLYHLPRLHTKALRGLKLVSLARPTP